MRIAGGKGVLSSKHRGGFTLVELMMVIAIIAILALVLVPKMGFMKVSAYEAGRDMSVRHVHALSTALITKFPPDQRWYLSNPLDRRFDYFNGRLEFELQNGPWTSSGDDPGSAANDTRFQNPYSRSKIVLVGSSPSSTTAYRDPYIFITNGNAYNYNNNNSVRDNLVGSVIVWIDSTPSASGAYDPVQIYYMDDKGRKCGASELILVD